MTPITTIEEVIAAARPGMYIIAPSKEARARWTGLDWNTGLSDEEAEALAELVAKDADGAREYGFQAEFVLNVALKPTRTTDICTAIEVALEYFRPVLLRAPTGLGALDPSNLGE